MRSAYRFLAYAIAALVAFQAAVMVFAVAGLYTWVSDGNELTQSHLEGDSDLEFTGVIGFMLHGMVGMMLIPLVALVLLIISFFAKIPGGVKWAGAVLALVILQVALGLFGHETPYSGLLHGLNALILFAAAGMAGRRATEVGPVDTTPTREAAPAR
jgi:hypothetical protein